MTDGEVTREELQRVESLLAGSPLASRNELLIPDPQQAYAEGTTVPLLFRTMSQTSSGLFVPTTVVAEAYPIDLMAVYLTWTEISGQRWPAEVARDRLSRVSRAAGIAFCAQLMQALNRQDADIAVLEQQLIREWFQPDMAVRVRTWLSQGRRRLISEQGVLTLLKRVLQWSPEDGDIPTLDDLVMPYFVLADHLREIPVTGADEPTPEGRRILAAEVVSNQWFNADRDVVGALARHAHRWADTDDPKDSPRRLFADAAGFELQLLEHVTLALWAVAQAGTLAVTSAQLAEQLSYPLADVEAALRHLSRSPAELAELVAEDEAREGFDWSFSAFERFPVINDAGQFVVYAPNLLLRRVFSWTATWDVREHLGTRGTAYTQLVQRRAEGNVRGAFQGMYPDVPTKRLYTEDDQALAFSTSGGPPSRADLVIDDVDAWLVVEITTSMPTRQTIAAADPDAYLQDVEKLLAKLRQIDSSIKLLREREALLTGHAGRARRFLPVLVCTEGFPVNPMTISELEERAADLGLLQGPDVAPLRLLSNEDLEAAEALVETHGVTLSELLLDHASSGLRSSDLRSYIIAVRHPTRIRPSRLDAVTDEAFGPIIERLGPDDG